MLEQCIFTISPVLGHFEAHLCCILWIYPYKESVELQLAKVSLRYKGIL